MAEVTEVMQTKEKHVWTTNEVRQLKNNKTKPQKTIRAYQYCTYIIFDFSKPPYFPKSRK